MKFSVLAATVFVMAIIAPSANAGVKRIFWSLLSVSQETPACTVATGALGNAIATYDRETKQFCYKLSYSGLSQEVEAASHIHAPGFIGETGPVLFTLPSGPDKGECITVKSRSAIDSLFNNSWYFNVHTAACPGGEIRGQIVRN